MEWSQHHFQYYNIQSLDIVQMPRVPVDLETFEGALVFDGRKPETLHRVTRRWQLTNTRYLLGWTGFLGALNQQVDPIEHRFSIVNRFDIVPKPGVTQPTRLDELTAVPATNGTYAIFEFAGALPRAKLYSNWQMPGSDPAAVNELRTSALSTNDLAQLKQIGTNDFLTLRKLASLSFDPAQTVLLADPLPAGSPTATNQAAGTVDFLSYAPKRIVLQAKAAVPSVLLLNDKHHPDWKVTVDGKPASLLRCNYIMRGVQVPSGTHTVEFRFQPATGPFYVTLAAIGLGVILLALLMWTNGKPE